MCKHTFIKIKKIFINNKTPESGHVPQSITATTYKITNLRKIQLYSILLHELFTSY